MASGRTISASFLTEKDIKVIELCNEISEALKNNITEELKRIFEKEN